jgi:hypothetical protein
VIDSSAATMAPETSRPKRHAEILGPHSGNDCHHVCNHEIRLERLLAVYSACGLR